MGELTRGRGHFDRAIALYDPVEHRPLAARVGQDTRVAAVSYRSILLWVLRYPEAALMDASDAVRNARETNHAATLIYALTITSLSQALCGNYAGATTQLDEAVALADEKGAFFWKATGMMIKGCALAASSKASDAVQMITSAVTTFRSTGATVWMPSYLSYLARAYSELGQFEDARRCIGEATKMIEASKETWYEAEVNRIAGEIALMLPMPDAEKRRHILSMHSPSRGRRKQSPGNSGRR